MFPGNLLKARGPNTEKGFNLLPAQLQLLDLWHRPERQKSSAANRISQASRARGLCLRDKPIIRITPLRATGLAKSRRLCSRVKEAEEGGAAKKSFGVMCQPTNRRVRMGYKDAKVPTAVRNSRTDAAADALKVEGRIFPSSSPAPAPLLLANCESTTAKLRRSFSCVMNFPHLRYPHHERLPNRLSIKWTRQSTPSGVGKGKIILCMHLSIISFITVPAPFGKLRKYYSKIVMLLLLCDEFPPPLPSTPQETS